MKAATFEGATRVLGAPKGWNVGHDGECVGLPILEAKLPSGQPCMISAWKPTPEELDRLMKGAAVELCVCGVVHPPVSMNVGQVPEPTGFVEVEGVLSEDQRKQLQADLAEGKITPNDARRAVLPDGSELADPPGDASALRKALARLMDQPTENPIRMTPEQRRELWAAHAEARAALGIGRWVGSSRL
jgi:hypothetical protein